MSQHQFEPDERGLVRDCPQCGQRNRLTYERLRHAFRCAACKTELAPPAEPLEVSSATVFDALSGRATLPVLIDFWAPWCGPCRMVAPEVEKAAQAGAGRWLVVKVNTESLPEVAQCFRIGSIPTFAVIENGRESTRQSGAMSAAAMERLVLHAARPA